MQPNTIQLAIIEAIYLFFILNRMQKLKEKGNISSNEILNAFSSVFVEIKDLQENHGERLGKVEIDLKNSYKKINKYLKANSKHMLTQSEHTARIEDKHDQTIGALISLNGSILDTNKQIVEIAAKTSNYDKLETAVMTMENKKAYSGGFIKAFVVASLWLVPIISLMIVAYDKMRGIWKIIIQ